MRFVIYRDNGAQSHWRLVSDDGGKLAVARRVAAEVREHAGSATGTED